MKLPIARVAGCDYYDGDLDGFVQDASDEWFAFGVLDMGFGSKHRVFGIARGDAGLIARAAAAQETSPRNWYDEGGELVPDAREAEQLFKASWATAGEVFAITMCVGIEEARVLHTPPPLLHGVTLSKAFGDLGDSDYPDMELPDMTLINWIEAGGDPIPG